MLFRNNEMTQPSDFGTSICHFGSKPEPALPQLPTKKMSGLHAIYDRRQHEFSVVPDCYCIVDVLQLKPLAEWCKIRFFGLSATLNYRP